ncbi:MAG TPA: 1-(5-phosphoribosyl)-5-((5-phosphoribosylamino)methylideneamino)imidazole-4-carboxamide isomerase, partial [Gammaproteobacteria bacterium]|nr:1-(5-phosphoribosyl)-5-((5-phosphoribosylamino)methylideneamino)imidazole-4-carboxamide isomerase [Gammaproteobacteria bacterium]
MVPTEIKLHRKSAKLELTYAERESVVLSAEFLRVHSPSAEVRGHGRGQEILQTGKRNVTINFIEAVGNYAIKLNFNDGHNSGIYSWNYLAELGENEGSLWRDYLAKLRKAGLTREPLPADTQVIQI